MDFSSIIFFTLFVVVFLRLKNHQRLKKNFEDEYMEDEYMEDEHQCHEKVRNKLIKGIRFISDTIELDSEIEENQTPDLSIFRALVSFRESKYVLSIVHHKSIYQYNGIFTTVLLKKSENDKFININGEDYKEFAIIEDVLIEVLRVFLKTELNTQEN